LTEGGFLVASGNRGKIREIRELLDGLPFDVLSLGDVFPGLVCPERGQTFLENARAKSLCCRGRWEGFVLGEDSGLEIEALAGAPGVFSARFSRPRPNDEKNIRKVLRLLRDAPPERRGARFVCTLALSRSGRIIREFRAEVRGRIAPAPKGTFGFGYDPIFFYPPLRKTFGELPSEGKNRVSHRGRALRKLRKFLESDIDGTPRRRDLRSS
jgi:XTP/dITP diphosphohydrolase